MRIGLWFGAGGVAAALTVLSVSSLPRAFAEQAPQAAANGETLFKQHCQGCHEPAIGRAPNRAALSVRPRGDIVKALTSGVMAPMAKGLAATDIAAIAAYLTPTQSAIAAPVGNDVMCASNPPI